MGAWEKREEERGRRGEKRGGEGEERGRRGEEDRGRREGGDREERGKGNTVKDIMEVSGEICIREGSKWKKVEREADSMPEQQKRIHMDNSALTIVQHSTAVH